MSHLGYLLDCPVDIHKMLQNSDLSFKSALLIPSILMNAVHSTNLFLCYSHYHVPTNTIALFLGTCLQTIISFFPSDKGVNTQIVSLKTLSIGQLSKPNYIYTIKRQFVLTGDE